MQSLLVLRKPPILDSREGLLPDRAGDWAWIDTLSILWFLGMDWLQSKGAFWIQPIHPITLGFQRRPVKTWLAGDS